MATQTTNQYIALATIRGALWTFASKYSGKIMVFFSTIILARLLTQEDYGVAGYAIVVIGFLEILSDVGVSGALIYYEDNPKIAHTAFYLNLLTGLVLFGITWAVAPLVGLYFNDDRAIPLTRALATIFPITSLRNVHRSLFKKRLRFGKNFVPDVVQSLIKGVFSIGFAFAGLGAWSLVLGQIAGRIGEMFSYWAVSKWRPKLTFDVSKAKDLLNYGTGLLSISSLGVFLLNIDYLLVGRYLGAAALGVYTLAFRIPDLVIKEFYSTLAQVLFPIYARAKEDAEVFAQSVLGTMRYVSLVTVPIGLGLAIIAEPFIIVFFGEKWLEAVPVLRAISIYTLLTSFAFNIGDIYKARGRLQTLWWLTIIRAVTLIPALYWAATVPATIMAVGWTYMAVSLFLTILNLVVASRVFDISLPQVFGAFVPSLLGGGLMSAALLLLLPYLSTFPSWLQLLTMIPVGGLVYVAFLWIVYRNEFIEAKNTLQVAFKRK